MTEQTNQRPSGTSLGTTNDQTRERPRRRPYSPPLIQSGAAFERVQLQSGCVFFDPLDCDPPCG